jgi:hypothetical protein
MTALDSIGSLHKIRIGFVTLSPMPLALKMTGITPVLPDSTRRGQFCAATQPQDEMISLISRDWSPVFVNTKKFVRAVPYGILPKSWTGSAKLSLGPVAAKTVTATEKAQNAEKNCLVIFDMSMS